MLFRSPFTSSLLLIATGQPIVWHTARRPSPEKKIEYQAVLGIETAANVYSASTWCGRRGNLAARSVLSFRSWISYQSFCKKIVLLDGELNGGGSGTRSRPHGATPSARYSVSCWSGGRRNTFLLEYRRLWSSRSKRQTC